MNRLEQFLRKPLPIPKNENGQLGFVTFFAIFPTLFLSIFAPQLLLVCLALLVITFALFAPYFIIIMGTLFMPIIVAAGTDDLEAWIEVNINYNVFTGVCILLGFGLMIWKLPETEVSKNWDRNKEERLQPGSPHNVGKRPPL